MTDDRGYDDFSSAYEYGLGKEVDLKASGDDRQSQIAIKGNPACGRCHMLVARYAPQVIASSGVYHRECFEAWYYGKYGERPALLPGIGGDRHRFRVREKSNA